MTDIVIIVLIYYLPKGYFMLAELIGCYVPKLIGLIIALAGLGFLIGFHELGHWLFAQLFGIATPTFSIGMGPQLLRKKWRDTHFTLSLIPLGGYVEIAGLAEVGQGEQKHANDRSSHSFARKPYWQKFLVMAGGILFNLLAALVILVALFMTGMPKSSLLTPEQIPAVIREVRAGQPAAIASLQVGDHIVSCNDAPIDNALALMQALRQHKDTEVILGIERNGTISPIPVTTTAQGSIGIMFEQPTGNQEPQPFITAVTNAWQLIGTIMAKLGSTFGAMFRSRSIDGLGGPLMIIVQMTQGVAQGISLFLALLAFISINLAALNLLPLPILDGGQLVLVTIESLIGRPISLNVRLAIHYACWIAFLVLFVFLTHKDIDTLLGGALTTGWHSLATIIGF